MSVFYQEDQSNPQKRCKYLASTFKHAFAKCNSSKGKLSISSRESEEPAANFDEEEEVFVSAIISKYMESKCKTKPTTGVDGFSWAISPETWDSIVPPKEQNKINEDGEDFMSVGSRLTRCSSATSYDVFISVKTRFSRSSSLNKIDFQEIGKRFDFQEIGRRSIILEFSHCEGWPFGLSRKALLPPLPKSPSDSWKWRKSGRMINIHG